MKKHQLLTNVKVVALLFVIFVSQACTRTENTALLPELTHAEAIMYQCPDSALLILEQMPMPPASNRLQHATWCLLLTQARYKNYIDEEKSDSLINIAYNYFAHQNNPQKAALAMYMKAALSGLSHKAEEATQYYLEAITEVEKTDDYSLAHLIYAELGSIYAYRGLYEHAMTAYQESHKYAKLSQDEGYIASALSYIGRIHAVLEDYKKAAWHYEEALKIARTLNNNRLLCGILNELSSVYVLENELLLSLKVIKETYEIEKRENSISPQVKLGLGDTYRLLGEIDSAYHYLKEAAQTDENIYTARSAYHGLYDLSKKERKLEDAIEYVDKYILYRDSIQKIDRGRALVEMQEKYNQQKVINEKNMLKLEKEKVKKHALTGGIILVCIIAITIILYQRKLLEKQRIIREKEDRIGEYSMKINDNLLLIAQNEILINEYLQEIERGKETKEKLVKLQNAVIEIKGHNSLLDEENKELRTKISGLHASLDEKKIDIDRLGALCEENVRLRQKEVALSTQLIRQNKTLNAMRTKPEYLDNAAWEDVYKAINSLFDDYTIKLNRRISSITESELRLACLIKLRLSMSAMATTLAISTDSVSKQKQRLKVRISKAQKLKLSGVAELEDWLREQ